ncbi:MAG: hexose kinase [Candidatus Omnitrophica bacterium]|nr:hexose kinase [Candidatus Omnitrophota bacterium]
MKPVITVTLNPAVDKTVSVAGFRKGQDFREQALSRSAGGKGIVVSRVLKLLGIPTLATGLLGGTDGAFIHQNLGKEKLPHSFTFIAGNSRTSLTILDPRSENLTRIMERGPRVSLTELSRFRQKYLSLLKNTSCVVFSGRSIPGAPNTFYRDLIRHAQKRNIPTVLDTSGEPLLAGLRTKPLLIKPNLQEAEEIIGTRISGTAGALRAAQRCLHQGISLVCLTMGSRGAIVADHQTRVLAVPPKVQRKNPVGCGDAFIAGFLSVYLNRGNLRDAARRGVACGTANSLSIDPGVISRREVDRIQRKITIKNL